jgi:hypothetical protein
LFDNELEYSEFWAGGKSDPYFHLFKAHGQVLDTSTRAVLAEEYTSPDKSYMGNTELKSLLAKSDIVMNCLDPKWSEVEVELDR